MLDSLVGNSEGTLSITLAVVLKGSPAAPGTATTHKISSIIAPPLGAWRNSFNQHRMFLEALRDGNQPFVSIASGTDDLRVVAAVYESAKTGAAVRLD